MRVMKFGGTSLGSPGGLERVVGLVAEAWQEEPVVVVASALAGVTQLISEMVSAAGPPCGPDSEAGWGPPGRPGTPDPIDDLRLRHLGAWREFTCVEGEGAFRRISDPGPDTPMRGPGALENAVVVSGIETHLEELRILRWVARAHGAWTPASRDNALGLGEALSSRLLVGALRSRGFPARLVDPRGLIRTDSAFGAARVDEDQTRRLVRETLGGKLGEELPVVPGFVGADAAGRPTTLGRGTSDYTATLLASALPARLVEIWTDVDGIFPEDPRSAPGAPLLERVDYGEARALALAGAKVLHPRSLDPLEGPGIPLRVRNTFRPHGPGTWVGLSAGSHTSCGVSPEDRPSAPMPLRSNACDSSPRPVHLILAGAPGGVGRTLLAQLRDVAPRLLEEEGVELRVAGLANSRTLAWFPSGVPLSGLPQSPEGQSVLHALQSSGTTTEHPFSLSHPPGWEGLVERLGSEGPANPIFVDCTASPQVAALYLSLLEAGIPVVTPNKLAVSGELSAYRRLRKAAREGGTPFLYEPTAGAALPVIRTLRDLVASGDRIREIRGVLSGTLSFVFHRLGEGAAFSEAVREARERGFTEPHPGEDLSGADVGRKLLILVREAGVEMEPREIRVESLVPEDLREEADPDRFLRGLEAYDQVWAHRVAEAGRGGLAYVASFREGEGEVGATVLLEGDSLSGLRPAENRIVMTSDRNLTVPITISGPGAGWEVTASGVLTDLLVALRERYPGGGPGRTGGGARKGVNPPGKRRVA